MNNFNASTQNLYSLSNQHHLEEHKVLFGLESDQWAGYKQWKELGRQVKKGSKSCKIYIVCDKKIESKSGDEEAKKKKVMKALSVFNLEQTEEI